jgi:monooxygenase
MSVIIIGAGMTGIAAAYYLRASNIPYTIVEASSDLGGVWNTHRWHGARCDSDFIKYSFSFKPFLSAHCLHGRQTIHEYLRSVAKEFSILQNIRFGTRVIKAVFNVAEQGWTVHTTRGSFAAQFLINGNGYFSDEPHVPLFKDAENFRGEIVHTSHLDSERTFTDKNVVVVGSGATAICCAPELARVSKSLVLLQRSPSYIYEISNRAGPLIILCQNLYRLGIRTPVKWLRWYLQLRDDVIFVGFRQFPRLARWFFRRHWLATVGEDALREHFTPRYNPWEQRIAVAIGLKDELRAGRITVKTAEIERFTESGIVLANGETIPCDTCILATGLNLRLFKFAIYVGERKVALERINLYKGVMAGGIPNYFHPMGSWHSAWTQRLEPVIQLAIKIIVHMKKRGFGAVSVPRTELEAAPGITPNYVMRCLATLPRLQGTSDLPSIDNLLANPMITGWCASLLPHTMTFDDRRSPDGEGDRCIAPDRARLLLRRGSAAPGAFTAHRGEPHQEAVSQARRAFVRRRGHASGPTRYHRVKEGS